MIARVMRTTAILAATLSLVVIANGCSVKAYERENLTDPIMAMDGSAKEDSRELKWLEAREASNGGIGGAGGGCACN